MPGKFKGATGDATQALLDFQRAAAEAAAATKRFREQSVLQQAEQARSSAEALRKASPAGAAAAVGLSVGAGALGALGSTGAAIGAFASASPLQKLEQLVEAAITTYFPQVVAKLDVLGRGKEAQAQVSPLLEQAARLGIQVPESQKRALIDQAFEGARRAQAARADVASRLGIKVSEDVGEMGGNWFERAADLLPNGAPRFFREHMMPRNR